MQRVGPDPTLSRFFGNLVYTGLLVFVILTAISALGVGLMLFFSAVSGFSAEQRASFDRDVAQPIMASRTLQQADRVSDEIEGMPENRQPAAKHRR